MTRSGRFARRTRRQGSPTSRCTKAVFRTPRASCERLEEDIAAKNPDRAADKLVALAYTLWTHGEKSAAIRAAGKRARTRAGASRHVFSPAAFSPWPAKSKRAREQASTLASELYAEPQAYAKIIEANVLLADGQPRQAIQSLTEANKLLDTWIGRFDLGRAYLRPSLPGADAEFDRCLKRRGEAMALFLDEVPTYGYFPHVHYYQGRVRQELGIPSAAESLKTFVAIRGQADEDPLVDDARRRIR